jgi:hypothetical protein
MDRGPAYPTWGCAAPRTSRPGRPIALSYLPTRSAYSRSLMSHLFRWVPCSTQAWNNQTIHLGPGLFSKEKWVQAELAHPQSVEATTFFFFRLSVISAQKTKLLLRLEISSFMVDRSNVGIKCMTEGLTSLSFCRVRCGLNEVAYILIKLCEVILKVNACIAKSCWG